VFAPSLNGTATAGDANALVNAGDTFTVDGRTITFASGDAPATAPTGFTKVTAIANTTTGNVYTDANGNATVYLGSTTKASVGDVLTAIDIASGVQSNVAGTLTLNAGQTASTVNGSGALLLKSSTGADLSFSGKADTLKALAHHFARCRQRDGQRQPHDQRGHPRQPDHRWLHAERGRPYDQLQERLHAVCGKCCVRLGRQRQRRHRWQRQLDGLPAVGDRRRCVEGG